MNGHGYPPWFHRSVARDSHNHVEPIVSTVLKFVEPTSVVDVGCGLGHFLAEFMRRGITDVVGIEFPGLDPGQLVIPQACFLGRDLNRPCSLGRTFDLALSLEVAEHLRPESADQFVNTLVGLAPKVVMSAAIPYQGGYRHLNEQWPDYWAEIFERYDYVVLDCLRDPLWRNPSVPTYYRQNMLLFVLEEQVATDPTLAALRKRTQRKSLSRVHPELYVARSRPREINPRFWFRSMIWVPSAILRVLKKRALRRTHSRQETLRS